MPKRQSLFEAHPTCGDCQRAETTVRYTGKCAPPFTVIYVCGACLTRREQFYAQNGTAWFSGREVELCVVCKAETPQHFGDNVMIRSHYVEGSGQHCARCCAKNQLCEI